MAEQSENSVVKISIGQNEVKIEGSEEFVSDELTKVLDRVDMSVPASGSGRGYRGREFPEDGQTGKSAGEVQVEQDSQTTSLDVDPELNEVANRIGSVDSFDLAEHFYIDENDIHIQNPLAIDPKFALLGYCTIKEIRSGEQYHDNIETKKKLIDVEKVDIEDWGGTLLYTMREQGLIKDDPNTERDRNKPFKITPKGRRKFVEWLNEDD